jgi:MoaA/NifB/PqqE/SkfB family radical SAM enzyme
MFALRRKARTIGRRLREARMVAAAFKSTRHPVLAQMVPIRRCNLSCAYCNEYDRSSPSVPAAEMFERVDRLAALGTSVIALSGGEPLLHPDVLRIIRRIRERGCIAQLLTNGYLLTPDLIKNLNRAGLDRLQISIDNLRPDDVSKKSLSILDRRLCWLAADAMFDVSINSVLGDGTRTPQDALAVARRAHELGFAVTVGLIHDSSGRVIPLSGEHMQIYQEINALKEPTFPLGRHDHFQESVVCGNPAPWHCRAGARYLYICEDGLVHRCSQQRGYPAVPLKDYTVEHIELEYALHKECEAYCTVSCVHRVAVLDEIRENPMEAIARIFPASGTAGTSGRIPLPARILARVFATGRHRRIFSRAALWALRVK